MAGVSRLQYPTDIRLIRVMCTGRIDLAFLLRSFLNGADAVFIGGCHLGECNYITGGNYHALNLVHLTRKLLAHIGLNEKRLRIEWCDAGEGVRFAHFMHEFSKEIKDLGPLGKSEGIDEKELQSKLEALLKLVPYIKLMKRDKMATRLQTVEEYNQLYTDEEINKLLTETVSYYIEPERCQACMICAKKCPVEAIIGGKNLIHIIDQNKCIKCGTCFEACPPRFGAVQKIVGGPVPPPIPEEKRRIVRK
jgi:coenzyme F420-reducing hydrogenase delta subunit/ferredoxin